MRNSWDGTDSVRSDAVRRAAAEVRASRGFGIALGFCVGVVIHAIARTLWGIL